MKLSSTKPIMLLEICANSFQSAANAALTGADRIELCQELQVGGITPSAGLIRQVVEKLEIPTFVLIRPRAGDFVYSDAEFEVMQKDIAYCKAVGCAGIVSGVLQPNGQIDLPRTRELVQLSQPLSFTFHRAFDLVPHPEESLRQLIEMKVNRILSSGGRPRAAEGIPLLQSLQQQAGQQLTLMPGGGINPSNAALFRAAGFREIHTSASAALPASEGLFGSPLTFSDPDIIKAVLDAIGR
jgi:copper homeostasis protein